MDKTPSDIIAEGADRLARASQAMYARRIAVALEAIAEKRYVQDKFTFLMAEAMKTLIRTVPEAHIKRQLVAEQAVAFASAMMDELDHLRTEDENAADEAQASEEEGFAGRPPF